jgi:hypothetical protein
MAMSVEHIIIKAIIDSGTLGISIAVSDIPHPPSR